MNSQTQILVVGSGSAGQRHGRNLRDLGCSISYFDPRADRHKETAADDAAAGRFTDLGSAISDRAWIGVVVASPPNFHMEQILQAQVCPVLSEKTLSIDAHSAARQLEYSPRTLLGYTYRWWWPLAEYRRRLQAGAIGSIRNMRFVMSAHLEDWHPLEPCQIYLWSKKACAAEPCWMRVTSSI